MKEKIYLFLLIFIFFLAIFLRFVKLGEVPHGLNQDETSIGYNAYSVLKTGKDEFGKTMPIYFRSFGDYKLPVYIYSVVPSILFFGLTPFAVRFPSALFGSMSVLLIYFLVKDLSKNKIFALICAAFLATNPWHIFFSRAGFEDNLALTFALLGTWLFVKGINTMQKMFFFIASVMSFVLSLYSYNVSRLLAPVLFVSLIFFYSKEIGKLPKKIICIPMALGIILLLPFIATFFSRAGISSAKGALITSNDIQAKLVEWRIYLLHYPFLGKIFFNKLFFLPWTYIRNIVGFLSTDFFFLTGTHQANQGIATTGMFYIFDLPFIIFGLANILYKRVRSMYFLVAWGVIVLLVASLSKEVPHATRGYFLVIPLTVFSAWGLYLFLQMKNSIYKKIACVLLAIVMGYSYIYFLTGYFIRFPIEYAAAWRAEDTEVVRYIQLHENEYREIIVDPSTSLRYTSFLFYQKISPDIFLREVKPAKANNEGLLWDRPFGKYQFRSIEWALDNDNPNLLFVMDKAAVDRLKIKPLKIFYYPPLPIALTYDEIIGQFEQKEVAYVLVASGQSKKF